MGRVKNILIRIFAFAFLFCGISKAQNNLEYYINAAIANNPELNEHLNNLKTGEIENSLIDAQNNSFQLYLTSDILVAPYLNNDGKIISTSPNKNAIGYDAGITNGGLYSAQLNLEKNIFNDRKVNVLRKNITLQTTREKNAAKILEHNLKYSVTDRYLSVYESQQLYNYAKMIEDTLRAEVGAAKALTKQGILKQTDLLLLMNELSNQEINTEKLMNHIQSNYSDLNTFCGIENFDLKNLDTIKLEKTAESKSSHFNALFKNDSLTILNQQELFETKYEPEVKVFVNTGLNAIELDNIERKFGVSAGINFSLPLYDGDQKNLKAQQTKISLENVSSYEKSQSIVKWSNMQKAESSIELYKNNGDKLKNQLINFSTILSISNSSLAQGQISIVDYLSIINKYDELKTNSLMSEINYQRAVNDFNYWNW